MELRVWVEGTQRVVCGVKLTTTCQEIVFALAHATQQAGRFTMIERWRNNERLLSPNEQPIVTLQRWGDHMKEVEFILRKTSSDLQPTNPPVQPPQQQPPPPQPQQLQPQQPQHHSSHNGLVIGSLPNMPLPLPHPQPINNSPVSYHQPNHLNIYPNHLRPRNPPGYLDYMEAIAKRNSLTQPVPSNPPYAQHSQHSQSNIFQRSFRSQNFYNIQQNGSSTVNISPTVNRFPNQSNSETNTPVSQMGLDMLKVIEEQKKVLINQKNELDRLDNDREYWETKHSFDEAELIDRIEKEIQQLEELWKENQTQIQKLENQDLERELEELKAEQVRMEIELEQQKNKLSLCEKDVVSCKIKIEQLEVHLAKFQTFST